MKILAIRIKNLASLEGNTSIDFSQEPLRSAGIFAITGATGAGKSTLLDALCLALYNKSPRYRLAESGIDINDVKDSTIKQDDVRGMLRDGSSEGFAEVDFEAVDGQHYRARWSVRRARNKADGNLQASEMSLKNISTNPHQDIPGKKITLLEATERLVGLNFEQFTRSVLLAQGDFTAFLKAGKDEKASLLEKLTGTVVFSEISKRVFENHREQQQKLRDMNQKRENITTLPQTELEALEKQIADLSALKKEQEQQLADIRKAINWQQQRAELQEALLIAQQKQLKAQQQKEAVSDRAQYLKQAEQVQPAKPLVHKLQHAEEQLASNAKEREQLQIGLSDLLQQKALSDTTIINADTALQAALQEEEQALPLLDEAKTLDIKLHEKKLQIKEAAAEHKEITERRNELAKDRTVMQQQSEFLSQEISRLSLWKKEHEARQAIAEQANLIVSKLSDASGLLKKSDEYNSRIREAAQKKEKIRQESAHLEQEKEKIQQDIRNIQNDCAVLQSDLAGISLQKTEAAKSTADAAVEDIIRASAHWELYYRNTKDLEKYQQDLEQSHNELTTKKAQLKLTDQLLEKSAIEKAAAQRSLEKAKLIAAKSVEQLRQQLEPEAPCPVCGSTTHPYAHQDPAMSQLLPELEADYALADAAYHEQLKTQSRLAELCAGLEKSISTTTQYITDLNATIQDAVKQWQQFQIYIHSTGIPLDTTSDWLRQQLLLYKNQQQELQEHLHLYHRKKDQFEKYKTQLAACNEQLNQSENGIKDHERKLQSLLDQQENDIREQKAAQNELAHIQQDLGKYFSTPAWFQNWQSHPETFIKSITDFATQWKSNVAALEQMTGEQNTLSEKEKSKREQSEENEKILHRKTTQLSELQEQEQHLFRKRQTLFHGASAAEAEALLKNKIAAARQTLEKARKYAEQLQVSIAENKAQQQQLEKNKTDQEKHIINYRKELDTWLYNYNQQYQTTLTTATLKPLLMLSSDWMEKESNSLRSVDHELLQATSVFKEREKSLAQHWKQQPSEQTMEQLRELQEELQTSLEENTKTLHGAEFRIKEHEKNRRQIGVLLQEIEQQSLTVEHWAKLNEVIGSADGKKFRQIAQEYTLDVLLSYANLHLEALSKRYILERIPHSLGLQVVDQDMGDELRTVFSLSGGESFLVSLALALGLASLSSNRMQVESLFIDEGFGSLDPATLHIAMDALERLHNQGRKVGVISHVQEMTERIPVQIRVSKLQNGKSKVEVVSV